MDIIERRSGEVRAGGGLCRLLWFGSLSQWGCGGALWRLVGNGGSGLDSCLDSLHRSAMRRDSIGYGTIGLMEGGGSAEAISWADVVASGRGRSRGIWMIL